MLRFFAGAAAAFLLLTGAFLLWQSRAEQASGLPSAPEPRKAASLFAASAPLQAPEASPKSREEKRFSRADKNKDGKIEAEELLGPRQKAFAKLDANSNGALSFQEWAVKTIDKFKGADRDHNGWLTAAEYATTAPPPPKHKTCSCERVAPADNNDD
ncbi:MAG: EF-hand domain-containing protein [Pseudomonadota bacterium]